MMIRGSGSLHKESEKTLVLLEVSNSTIKTMDSSCIGITFSDYRKEPISRKSFSVFSIEVNSFSFFLLNIWFASLNYFKWQISFLIKLFAN